MPRKIEKAERAEPALESKSARVECLLTARDAANLLRLSQSWLAKSRMRGDGPAFMRLGRSIRYREADLVHWMKARLRLSTSER
jgi:predicted DNA-binding transcriptional regulator AlpA